MALKSEGKALRVGAAQFDAVAGNITANAATHETLIDEAGGLGVEVLVFPELSLPGYASSVLNQTPERCVVDPDGPDLNPLRDACRRNRIVAVVGGCLRNARGLGLSAIVVDRQGQICATYDKQHLSGPEQDWFVPGASGCMIEVDGWLLALGICYDSSFPEHGRALALEGADAYLVSGAFPRGESDHRRSIFFPARALENTIYVAFANFVGAHDGLEYRGRSAVHGPDGRLLADAGPDQPGIAVAELDPERLRRTRETLPMLRERIEDRPAIQSSMAR
ncbi:MAG: carbon-nitrogen hydrolase family protein [Alphaproteobacteria bacterium]